MWTYVATTAKEEKEQRKFDRACELLWMDDSLSNEALIKRLRDDGVRGNNEELRSICTVRANWFLSGGERSLLENLPHPRATVAWVFGGSSAHGRQKR